MNNPEHVWLSVASLYFTASEHLSAFFFLCGGGGLALDRRSTFAAAVTQSRVPAVSE